MIEALEYREFNFDQAKAGANIMTKNRTHVEIFKWDANSTYPICGLIKKNTHDFLSKWGKDGVYYLSGAEFNDLVMAPMGYVEGKPVFVGDKVIWNNGNIYKEEYIVNENFRESNNFFLYKSKFYPTSNMEHSDLCAAYNTDCRLASVANEAIKRAIDDNQVIPTTTAEENYLEVAHAALDMAIDVVNKLNNFKSANAIKEIKRQNVEELIKKATK